ncbi:MAG: hypothetical protein IT352_01385, partial [Gemmatimonadales bacterium]|nr:hypothetical protein [Gemmatimonadales bacterium]
MNPTRRSRWFAAVLLSLTTAGALTAQQPSNAETRLRALVAAVNTGDAAKVRAFVETTYSPEFLKVAPIDYHVDFVLGNSRGRPGLLELTGVE